MESKNPASLPVSLNPASILQEPDTSLVHTTFLQREENTYHHGYNEELLQYQYVRDGDMRSIEESKRMFRTGINGKLSDDPVRDKKYLFVASVTLTTRFCIEGGMKEEDAYNISDLYIQRMDHLKTVQEVYELQTEMIRDFTEKMALLRRGKSNLSPATHEAMDYIYYHLHEKLTIPQIAGETGLSPNYLSELFKKEIGQTILQYITEQRIIAAKNMLQYSKYTETEIAYYLAFSSPSHFIRNFKKLTGQTPKEFKKTAFNTHREWAGV